MADYFRVAHYYRPRGLEEAIDCLAKGGADARLLAGGTDLLNQKPSDPMTLVDISGLALAGIDKEDQGLVIGAGTTINQVRRSPLLADGPYGILPEAADCHSTATIRNMATIGGNLCNASPCADLALPLLVLDAGLIVAGPDGERTIALAEFFRHVNHTALKPSEILLKITLPPGRESAGWSFLKLRRHQTAVDIALVNVATLLEVSDGVICDSRIAMGSVAPTPMRAFEAETLLIGQKASPDLFRKAALAAADASKPIDDVRTTASYRKKMTAVLVRRSLEASLARCAA